MAREANERSLRFGTNPNIRTKVQILNKDQHPLEIHLLPKDQHTLEVHFLSQNQHSLEVQFLPKAQHSLKAFSANPLGFGRAECFESSALILAGDGAS